MGGLGLDDLINDTVLLSLLGGHEEVPVAVLLDLVLGLISVLGNEGVEDLTDVEDLLGLDLNISSLALGSAEGLVDHNSGVWEGAPLALGPSTEKEGAHTGSGSEADSANITGDVLHGVVDRHASGDGATRGVNVQGDVLGGILIGEEKKLGDKDVGNLIINWGGSGARGRRWGGVRGGTMGGRDGLFQVRLAGSEGREKRSDDRDDRNESQVARSWRTPFYRCFAPRALFAHCITYLDFLAVGSCP